MQQLETDFCCQFLHAAVQNTKYRKHLQLLPVLTSLTTISLHSDSLYVPERDGEKGELEGNDIFSLVDRPG